MVHNKWEVQSYESYESATFLSEAHFQLQNHSGIWFQPIFLKNQGITDVLMDQEILNQAKHLY